METRDFVVMRKTDGKFLKGPGVLGGWCDDAEDAAVFTTVRGAENAANVRTPRGFSRFHQWAALQPA